MEHKLNKVDAEIIQKVIDITKEGRVQTAHKSEAGTTDYNNKGNFNYYKKQNAKGKNIVVDAYKDNKEITIDATKYDDNVGGKYIDKKR